MLSVYHKLLSMLDERERRRGILALMLPVVVAFVAALGFLFFGSPVGSLALKAFGLCAQLQYSQNGDCAMGCRLVGEDVVWARLEPRGLERMRKGELGSAEQGAQVALMRLTAVLEPGSITGVGAIGRGASA